MLAVLAHGAWRPRNCRGYSSVAYTWFRAVDVPTSKPKAYNYVPTGEAQQYEMFAKQDNDRLERAFLARKPSETVETDGLVTVYFDRQVCGPTYWDGPTYRVRRSLWFEVLGNHNVVPVDAAVEAEIERCYNGAYADVKVMWPSEKGGKVPYQGEFVRKGRKTTLILNNASAWISFLSRKTLVRGLPCKLMPKKTRPVFKPRKIKHLVFCIHGIGQLLSLRYAQLSYIKDIDSLRTFISKTLDKTAVSNADADAQTIDASAEPESQYDTERDTERDAERNEKHASQLRVSMHAEESGIQVLPIMWRNQLIDGDSDISPQQLFGSANVAADAVLDFVMYTEPHHKRRMLETAVQEMNATYRKFCALNPEFAEHPAVSIIGHSLGSVMAYEIVTAKLSDLRLEFAVRSLFLVGSPLGILKLIRRDVSVDMGCVRNLYNIMRLTDPVASRLEPLVTKKALSFSPSSLPSTGNLYQQVKSITDDLAKNTELIASKASAVLQMLVSEEKKQPVLGLPPASERLPELAAYNRHGRLDFSVTETLDISMVVGIIGHLMYLDNPDVVQFIVKEILERDPE